MTKCTVNNSNPQPDGTINCLNGGIATGFKENFTCACDCSSYNYTGKLCEIKELCT